MWHWPYGWQYSNFQSGPKDSLSSICVHFCQFFHPFVTCVVVPFSCIFYWESYCMKMHKNSDTPTFYQCSTENSLIGCCTPAPINTYLYQSSAVPSCSSSIHLFLLTGGPGSKGSHWILLLSVKSREHILYGIQGRKTSEYLQGDIYRRKITFLLECIKCIISLCFY